MGTVTVLGMVSPALVGAPLLAVPAYALAVRGDRRSRLRWLLVVSPLFIAGVLLLCAFWALPLHDWLSVVASREPPRVFSPLLYPLLPVSQVLGLHGLEPTNVEDRLSMSPAVWVPALAGLVAAAWDRRARLLALLAVFGLVSMTAAWLYAVVYEIPIVSNLVSPRSGMLYVQFGVPILAGLGLVSTLPELARIGLRRLRVPSAVGLPLAALLAIGGLLAGTLGVLASSQRVQGAPHRTAYGAFSVDVRDIWKRHHDDSCAVSPHPRICESPVLSDAFNIAELRDACRARDGSARRDLAICPPIGGSSDPAWNPADDGLVTQTVSWCRDHSDPVCAAVYHSLPEQLDPKMWRQPGPLCAVTAACSPPAATPYPYRNGLRSPPSRAVLDANADPLLKGFHQLTGGAQSYGYNYQLLPSPDLDAFALDTMLAGGSPQAARAEMAARVGADAVVLGGGQEGLAAVYEGMGWRKLSDTPLAYAPPRPSGLAAQWDRGTAALVIGSSQNTGSYPYNGIFEEAVRGMIPASSAWLARGRSPNVDDYSDDELARFPVLVLIGYGYHDASSAWQKLDRYVRNGGHLYVETGWQFVDPDWNVGAAPPALPVTQLQWGQLDPHAPVMVGGRPASGWGPLTYEAGGWGASSSDSVRPGAEPLVRVHGRVVAARWTYGRGQVLWSGMNLISHAALTKSKAESAFLADQWRWLLPASPPARPLGPAWPGGDTAELPLQASPKPAFVLFRESAAPGWSARLVWPGGSQDVPIEPAEMDFMLVRLDRVPAGARLVFDYGPTWRERAWWALSLLTLLGLLGWLALPRRFDRTYDRILGAVASGGRRAWAALKRHADTSEQV
jgi:hypothetical protein